MRWKWRGLKVKGLKVEGLKVKGIDQIKTNCNRIFGAGLGNLGLRGRSSYGSGNFNAGIHRKAVDVLVKPVLRNGFGVAGSTLQKTRYKVRNFMDEG